jgi:putative transposase
MTLPSYHKQSLRGDEGCLVSAFAAEIRKRRIQGPPFSLWQAVDLRGKVLESFVTKRRGRKAALKLLHKAMKRYGRQEVIVTDLLRSFPAAMKIFFWKRQTSGDRSLAHQSD